MKLYQAIAQNARLIAEPRFQEAAKERQKRIEAALPSGSGFDAGTCILKACDAGIVLETEFHHMDENGSYDGWTQHRVTIRASLTHGICISVSGRNRNGIKEYIADTFYHTMMADFEWTKT